MNENQYEYLLGKNKKEIAKELGNEFNYYQSDIWTYVLDLGWFGMKKILVIGFKDNKVFGTKIKKIYGNKLPSRL